VGAETGGCHESPLTPPINALSAAIAAAEADTGAKLISLATVEPNPELSSAMRKVGRGFESLAGIAHAQVRRRSH
jgi:hypothetical protein